jgi:hypothetical protein
MVELSLGSSGHGESVAQEDDDEDADEEKTMAERRAGGARLTGQGFDVPVLRTVISARRRALHTEGSGTRPSSGSDPPLTRKESAATPLPIDAARSDHGLPPSTLRSMR